jgi:hypothetical protein
MEDSLRMVQLNHEQGTSYLDVDLKNQANAEASVMREYHGRYLFELLQNANDAIRATDDELAWRNESPYRVRIELTEDALIVANDGVPFLEKDVDSIRRWGESSKDPNKSIGYKGIGFKSVLEITDSPEVFSQVVQFRFDRKACYALVRSVVGSDVDLKLPITRFVLPYVIEHVPADDGVLVRRLLEDEGYATVIRLPLKVASDGVLERIEEDIHSDLLLFLGGIERIEIWHRGKKIRTLRKRPRTDTPGNCGQRIALLEGSAIVSRWLLFEAPKQPIEDRAIVDDLADPAWNRVEKVGLAVALPLDRDGNLQPEPGRRFPLHVYFPTNLPSGLRFLVHADFYIDAARKQVPHRAYNRWLAERVARFVRLTVLPELVERYPGDARIVQLMVPCGASIEAAGDLQEALQEELAESEFVPAVDGTHRSPKRIMLAPQGTSSGDVGFQTHFPPEELSRRARGRQFPIAVLESDPPALRFLTHLGASRLSFADVFRLLDGRAVADDPGAYAGLYGFLWYWREQLGMEDRARFSRALSQAQCIVTDKGRCIKPRRQLYHAKLRQETPNMPSAISAQLIHPSAYDENGRAGPTYRLLDTLEPRIRDYDAADIIRTAVVALFQNDRFRRVSLAERSEVYRYLFDYWRSRRGSDADVEAVKSEIQVPAKWVVDRRGDVWRSVDQVYLSSVWTGDDRLERLYEGMEGIAFLYDVRGLEVSGGDRPEWARFWSWLGVHTAPRVLVDSVTRTDLYERGWDEIRHTHPHAGTSLWVRYVEQLEKEYASCPRHGNGYRRLRQSIALEGFAALIESGQVERFPLLYGLLGEQWAALSKSLRPAEIRCYRSECSRYGQRERVLSFFEYLARNAAWIPAQRNLDGTPETLLYRPDQCWLVSAGEDLAIRNLLPTPPASYRANYDQFRRYLRIRSIEEASLSDLLDILTHLPEVYPDPNTMVYTGRRATPRALRTLTRWVLERMNNLLGEGDSEPEPPPCPIPLIARQGDDLRYIRPPERPFFADDRYHRTRWQDHVPFAPVDDNWQGLARYLGLPFISEHVTEQCIPGRILEAESARLETRLKVARPYMLAVVDQQRGSATRDTARYLDNLQVAVVDRLVVHRRLTLSPSLEIADTEARVYLDETTGTRTGSAGRAPREGTLYVRLGFDDHYSLMSGPIANYVRIPALADAFLILLDRGGKNGRLRYLDARGLGEENVEAMRRLLVELGYDVGVESEGEPVELDEHLRKALAQDIGVREPLPDTTLVSTGKRTGTGSDAAAKEPKAIEFPELNLAAVVVTRVERQGTIAVVPSARPGRTGRRGGRGGARDWERDQRLLDAYGQRGEELVYKLELQRLHQAGYDRPDQQVSWLRREGYNYADHDLESWDLVNGEWVQIVIEVKSTPLGDFRFPMTKSELACAQQCGERYRLYRVINVASAAPQVCIFGNPFTLWKDGRAYIEPRDTYVTLPDPRQEAVDRGVGE